MAFASLALSGVGGLLGVGEVPVIGWLHTGDSLHEALHKLHGALRLSRNVRADRTP